MDMTLSEASTSTTPEASSPETSSPETSSQLSSDTADSPAAQTGPQAWQVNLLYDGDCPLCVREVNFLRKKDNGRGIVKLTDIADINYRAEDNGGVAFETAMGRIHAVLADGTVVKNVEVFQRTYDALGIGWIYAVTKWPVIGPMVDKVYDLWADKRLAMTGRPSLAEVVAQREEKIACAKEGRCQV